MGLGLSIYRCRLLYFVVLPTGRLCTNIALLLGCFYCVCSFLCFRAPCGLHFQLSPSYVRPRALLFCRSPTVPPPSRNTFISFRGVFCRRPFVCPACISGACCCVAALYGFGDEELVPTPEEQEVNGWAVLQAWGGCDTLL